MKMLSRRTALAAVPLLAAATTMAGTARASASPTAVSPHVAALVKEYHWCKAEWHRLSDKLEDQANVLKAAGLRNPHYYRAHRRPEGLSDSEWAEMFEQYKARYDAQPEVIRLKKIEKTGDRPWDRKVDIAAELSVTRAETFADLQAQFDIWLDYYVDKNRDGSVHGMSDMGGPELRFILRLPDEIRRLASAA